MQTEQTAEDRRKEHQPRLAKSIKVGIHYVPSHVLCYVYSVSCYQGRIELPKAARGHATYIDGKMLSVTKINIEIQIWTV